MKKILLIDNSDFFANELIAFLSEHSIYCLRCKDYQSAINEQRTSSVSSLIIEFFSNSIIFEFLNNTRYVNPYATIIVCADYFSKEDLIALKKLGIKNIFIKPFCLQEILKIVRGE